MHVSTELFFLFDLYELIDIRHQFPVTEFDQEQYDRIRRREGFEDGAQQITIEDAVMLINEYHEKPEIAAQKMNAPLDKASPG